MRTSDSLSKIAPAICKALAEIKNPEMTGMNPHFRKPYATLAHITCQIRPIMEKHGLCVLQDVAEGPSVSTMIVHTSGEWMASEPLLMAPERPGPHGTMAAVTYARRGSLCAMLSITGEEDDDGNSAMPKRSESAPQTPRTPPSGGKQGSGSGWAGSSEAQQKCIFAKARGIYKVPAEFDNYMEWMKSTYEIDHTKELSKSQAKEVIDGLVQIEEEQKP